MQKLAIICHWLELVSEWSGKIVKFLPVLIAGVICFEVISRYFFNSPTLWSWETETAIFAIYILLGGAYALFTNAHVSMDALYSRLSLRRRAVLDLFSYILFFLFCGVMAWKGLGYAWYAIVTQESTHSAWGSPYWPLKTAIFVGAVLIILQGVAKFIRNLHIAIKKRDFA